ncbi:hypothetical protein BCR34DRAFT_582529 [Clohesyomyces aquaticus]|uniref:Uncharacterized protein n=1 Tax=Clohesyomyces aquaticus TaxID=1231657 RepID=A0A1Y2A9I7_9PLEO|nr:hypothetical protein BCR34DRAFT_582529 [Clohesyomyces aquaticus]
MANYTDSQYTSHGWIDWGFGFATEFLLLGFLLLIYFLCIRPRRSNREQNLDEESHGIDISSDGIRGPIARHGQDTGDDSSTASLPATHRPITRNPGSPSLRDQCTGSNSSSPTPPSHDGLNISSPTPQDAALNSNEIHRAIEGIIAWHVSGLSLQEAVALRAQMMTEEDEKRLVELVIWEDEEGKQGMGMLDNLEEEDEETESDVVSAEAKKGE